LLLDRHLENCSSRRRMKERRTTRIMRIIITIKTKMILLISWKMKMTTRMRKYERHQMMYQNSDFFISIFVALCEITYLSFFRSAKQVNIHRSCMTRNIKR